MGKQKFILALPKGRILDQVEPILKRCDIIPDPGFNDEYNRGLRFKTNHENLDIIRVRAFDVATFVATIPFFFFELSFFVAFV